MGASGENVVADEIDPWRDVFLDVISSWSTLDEAEKVDRDEERDSKVDAFDDADVADEIDPRDEVLVVISFWSSSDEAKYVDRDEERDSKVDAFDVADEIDPSRDVVKVVISSWSLSTSSYSSWSTS